MSCPRSLHRISLFVLLAGMGSIAWAGPQARQPQPRDHRAPPQQDETPAHERRGDHRALSDAVRRAERATRGQVLSAERVQYDGRDVNRVKIVDDRGRVRVYWDDPDAKPDRADGPRSRRTRDDDDDSD